MSSKFELLYNQLSEDQINQIIQGLRGEQPMNNDIEVDEQLVNILQVLRIVKGPVGEKLLKWETTVHRIFRRHHVFECN
jgi:hypothetical protein